MDNRYPCDIIRDLLPGYIDEVLSDAGRDAVKSHLEWCEACSEIYREMKEGAALEAESQEQSALDGFKKIRRRTRRLRAAVAVVSFLLLFVLLAAFWKVFLIGNPLPTSWLEVTRITYDEEAESLTVEGEINASSVSAGRVVWKPDKEKMDEINIRVYGVQTLPARRDKSSFSVTIPNMKGYRAYLACPEYDRMEVYSWKNDHYELVDGLIEQLYQEIRQLDPKRDILGYSGGIEDVGGEDGLVFYIDYLVGVDASYWQFNDQFITDGGFSPADFDIWISLEEPHEIRIRDYQTGAWTEDFSIISERRPAETDPGATGLIP